MNQKKATQIRNGLLCVVACTLLSCQDQQDVPKTEVGQAEKTPSFSFEQIPSSHSGITFENTIIESDSLNYVKYMHIYQGAGLATADFNQDGLMDIYAVSNSGENALYLNQGDFVFEDVTSAAGVASPEGWSTGVSVVDINNDGYPDIYLCKSGWFDEGLKRNKLFVNNQDGTFTERAQEYDLDIGMNSTQASFFDYDRDGDLDVYIVNHSDDFSLTTTTTDLRKLERSDYWNAFGAHDLLLRNDGGTFVDVSAEAGIYDIAFGLNVLTVDVNKDGWTDIYVSNDFLDPDVYYQNNGDGTFSDKTAEAFPHISFYGMGSDVGDVNNDGNPDVIVLDMAAPDHYRSKTLMPSMDSDLFRTMTHHGYHYQYMRNSLQLGSGIGEFQEIAQYAGVSKTDWSWAPLFADFNGDGLDDLFVTNGILKDVTNNDANNEVADEGRLTVSWQKLNSALPSTKLRNFVFQNSGKAKFKDVSKGSGLDFEGFSHGAVVADFDNDGKLDVATNNTNAELGLFKNTTSQEQQSVKLRLNGHPKNMYGVGASILVVSENQQRIQYVQPTRGYLSSMLNQHISIVAKAGDNIRVVWPDGFVSEAVVPAGSNHLDIEYAQAKVASSDYVLANSGIEPLFETVGGMPEVVHKEPTWNEEFNKEILLPHRLSQNGPCLATADINNDGLEDIFVGGGAGNPPTVLVANSGGGYSAIEQPALYRDMVHEDVAAVFFDVNNDGWQDLYVGSGSTEFGPEHVLLQDRLYVNTGGVFERSALPQKRVVTRAVSAGDYDGDGDVDVFVGTGSIPGSYPLASESYVLTNNNGVLEEGGILQQASLGIVTAAASADVNGDGNMDVVVVGEWEAPTLLLQENGKLTVKTVDAGDVKLSGWWRGVALADVDGNGETDIICGNVGANQKFKASQKKPFNVFYNDFDENGQGDIVLAQENKGELLPVRGLECSSQQMPMVAERHTSFESFATSSLEEIYTAEKLDQAYHKEAFEFYSGILYQHNGQFQWKKLPWPVQLNPVRGIVVRDLNEDGILDIVTVGDDFHTEVETTRLDAGIGTVVLGTPSGEYQALSPAESGLCLSGDQRNIVFLERAESRFIAVSSNSGPLVLKKLKKNLNR